MLYRAAKQRFDEEPEFKVRSREAVTLLQGGRPEYLQAWRRICNASRQEFQKIYDRLEVELTGAAAAGPWGGVGWSKRGRCAQDD